MRKLSLWLSVLLLSLLLSLMTLAGCNVSPAQPASAPNPVPSGAPQEGIAVHGHWTIEVRNPDGTLAERREFDNALVDPGEETLANLLARRNSAGAWSIRIGGSSGNHAFLLGSEPSFGLILESTYAGTHSNEFKTLTVTVSGSPARLQLSGTATAQRDGNISQVSTWLTRLPATAPPSSSYEGLVTGIQFTATTLPAPVILTNGQQVLVTVEISFD